MKVLGIDIGGSGIKGAPVDLATGELAGPRHRIPTPDPSEPEAVARSWQLARHFNGAAPSVAFPAIVHHRTVLTAANVDDLDRRRRRDLFERTTGCSVCAQRRRAAGLADGFRRQTARRRRHRSPSVRASAPPSSSKATCCPTPS